MICHPSINILTVVVQIKFMVCTTIFNTLEKVIYIIFTRFLDVYMLFKAIVTHFYAN